MPVEGVDLFRVRLPFREPFRSAHGVEADRESTLVRVRRVDGGHGWGECVALTRPTYTAEWADGAYEVLRVVLVPALLAGEEAPVVGHPFARAALAGACMDASLRVAGTSLATAMGGERRVAAMCTVVGRADTVDDLIDRVGAVVDGGGQAVSLKIAPGWDLAPLRAVRDTFPDLSLSADANGSYGQDAPLFSEVDALALTHLEQPLAGSDLLGHAELRRRLQTPIALDESITSADALAIAAELGALDMANLKPSRLGGATPSLQTHAVAAARGIPLYVGGMVEAGVGRAFAAAFTSLPACALPTHLGPTDRYLEFDLVDPLTVEGDQLVVPTGPGIGVAVDESAVDAFLVDRVSLSA